MLLNILGRRDDGFHELETLMQPVPMTDELRLERKGKEIHFTCSDSQLAVDESNLVHRAAKVFLSEINSNEGVEIHLQKNLPLAAGIGAGSANAAYTIRGLNEIWGEPLEPACLQTLAAGLGSDVPFFLQDEPALAGGRGEQVESLRPFKALEGAGLLMVNPGFGINTPWAYRQLGYYPDSIKGRPGRAKELADALREGTLSDTADLFYNSFEVSVFAKHAILPVIRDFFRDNGTIVAMMSGSGATMFALTSGRPEAEVLRSKYHSQFGQAGWSRTALL